MKNFIVLWLVLVLATLSGAQAQNRAGALAAAAAPGQVPTPAAATPQLTIPPGAGAPRPTAPAQPGQQQQQQEQLRVVADPATNSLIIYGTVQEFQNIKSILKELDIVPRQVLMDVMVVEVTLTDSESFGITYEIMRGNNTIFNRTFPSTGAVVNPLTPPLTDSGGAIITALTGFPPGMSGIIGRSNVIRAFINALAAQNRIRTLASPSVLATDNRPARIQVGSEIPVLSSTSQSTIANSQVINSVQYRNTGVILTIIPQVNAQGLVNLQVKQEVSDVGADSFGQTNSPSFTTRDAETTAVVQDGETMAIGGIIADRKTRDRSGIPYLMDLPVLGRFFGTTSDNAIRTELIILITPHVVRNKQEARDVTADFKTGLEKVREELERIQKDKARLLPPRRLPPLPDPNQYYQYDQQQPAPTNPPVGPRTSLPPAVENVTVLSNDPITRRMMPPMVVPQESMPISLAQTQPMATQSNNPTSQSAPPALAAPPAYILSFAPASPVPASAAPAVPVSPAQRQTPADARRIWTVQVAALGEKGAAESLAQKLRRLGYDAYVRVVKSDNKTWHRVRIGQLENQKDAADLRNILSSTKEHKDAYIAPY